MNDPLHVVDRARGNAQPGAALDVRELLARGASAAGPQILLRDASGSRTGDQLLESVPRIADQLAGLNAGRGQVVLIDAAPAIATVEAYWAALHAGLVPLLLPRDCPIDLLAPALASVKIRGGFATESDGVSKLRALGASTGLAAGSDASVALPEGWSRVSARGERIKARHAFSDHELCALAVHRTPNGTAAASARSHRTVALTGLLGQFLLAPGDGEVIVTGNPGGALFEWILHCAVMARAPVTFGGAALRADPSRPTKWVLAVASSSSAGAGIAASRNALVHDVTFAEPRENEDATADLQLCASDSSGFLFMRNHHSELPGWLTVPLVQSAHSARARGPAKTLADALAVPVRSPQQGDAACADVGTLMRSAAAEQPNAPAIIQDGITITYGAFADRAGRLSSLLRGQYAVERGDRVAFLALNRPEFFETYLASVQLGGVFTPLNFRLSAAEVRTLLDDCAPRVLIAEADLVAQLGPARDWLPIGVKLLPMAPYGERPCEYNAQLEASEPLVDFVRLDDDDPSSILYTTGTTGRPKGAVRSHKSVLWFSLVFGPLSLRQEPGGTHLATPPLFHIAGHETAPLPALALGRKVVIQNRFDARRMLADIEQHRVTSAFSPPTIAVEIAQVLRKQPFNLTSLRDWSSGSAPMSVEARDVICAAAPGLRFRNSLGMTEAGGIAALQGARLYEKPATCVGQVAPAVGVRIAGAHDETLPPLSTGEIQLRSPQLLTSYWNRADETRSAFGGGWFRTGDLGLFDADGDLHIVGRLKDMIITGGENVYAAEVERALLAVPGVAEAAVIGVPDPKWGESVVAWVVPETGAHLTHEIVVDHCRKQIAHYKCPRRCIFAPTLPRNAIGKVQKQKLRDEWEKRASVGG